MVERGCGEGSGSSEHKWPDRWSGQIGNGALPPLLSLLSGSGK